MAEEKLWSRVEYAARSMTMISSYLPVLRYMMLLPVPFLSAAFPLAVFGAASPFFEKIIPGLGEVSKRLSNA